MSNNNVDIEITVVGLRKAKLDLVPLDEVRAFRAQLEAKRDFYQAEVDKPDHQASLVYAEQMLELTEEIVEMIDAHFEHTIFFIEIDDKGQQ